MTETFSDQSDGPRIGVEQGFSTEYEYYAAMRMAYDSERRKQHELATQHRRRAREMGSGVLGAIKKTYYTFRARSAETSAGNREDRIEQTIAQELPLLGLARWYAPSESLYGRAIQNAKGLFERGGRDVSRELQDDFERTAIDAYEHRHPTSARQANRSWLAEAIEEISLVLASPEDGAEVELRSIGESTLSVKRLFALLGMSREQIGMIPSEIPRVRGDWIAPDLAKLRNDLGRSALPMVTFEDPSGRLSVVATFLTEERVTAGEEQYRRSARTRIHVVKHPHRQQGI